MQFLTALKCKNWDDQKGHRPPCTCLSRVAHVSFHNMASFVSVHVCTAKKTLVPWTVLSLSPSKTFEDLLTSVQAGHFSIVKMSNKLSAALLTSGSDKLLINIILKILNE